MNNKAENKDPTTQRESFTELLGQIANNSAAVFHDEIELVIQRIREKVTAVRSGILTVATGAVISFAAFMSFCAALIIELTLYDSRPCDACRWGGAGFYRCRHCLHWLQAIEEIDS